MITWETWSNSSKKRICVSRNEKGQFIVGNFHFPKNWLTKNPKKSLETRNKISDKLSGIPLNEERKNNIKKATIKAMKREDVVLKMKGRRMRGKDKIKRKSRIV